LFVTLLLSTSALRGEGASIRIDAIEPEVGFTYPSSGLPDAFSFRISHMPTELHSFTAVVEVVQRGKPVWVSSPVNLSRSAHTDDAFVTVPVPAGVSFVGGLEYRWVVHLFDAQGDRLARSPRMDFSVENEAPVVRIQSADSQGDAILHARVGDTLLLKADVHDAEDEMLGFRTDVDWWVSKPEADAPIHIASGRTLSLPVHVPGAYLFEATAVDKFGRTGSAQMRVVVEAGLTPGFVQPVPIVTEIPCESLEVCPIGEDDLPRPRVEVVVTSNTAEGGPEVFFSEAGHFFYVGDVIGFVAQAPMETEYEWYWYADGVEAGRDSTYNHVLSSEGDTEITLEVVDAHGRRASDTTYLVGILDRQPPQIRMESLVDGAVVPLGQPVRLSAEAEDPQGPDRVLPLSWYVNGKPLPPDVEVFVPEEEGVYSVTVSGRDRAGNYGGTSITVMTADAEDLRKETETPPSWRIADLRFPVVGVAGHCHDIAAVIDDKGDEPLTVTWLVNGAPVTARSLRGAGELAVPICFPYAGEYNVAVRVEDRFGRHREWAGQLSVINPKGPTIVWPLSRGETTLLLGNPVYFEALNLPVNATVEWVSDQDGLLAEGKAAFEAELSPGFHEIALWMDDFVTTVEIVVDDTQQPVSVQSMATACSGGRQAEAMPLDLEHKPIDEAAAHMPQVIRVGVPDHVPIRNASLFLRPQGFQGFYRIPMMRFQGEYRAIIPADLMEPGAVEYFVEVMTADCRTVSYPSFDAARKPLRMVVHDQPTFDTSPNGSSLDGHGTLEIGGASFRGFSGVVDAKATWGPLDMRLRLDSSEEHEHEVHYRARLLQVALGHVSSAAAPLGLDHTYHKGIDMTMGLGPLSLQVVHGRITGELLEQPQTRELVALRPSLYTEPLNFALSVVKIRDEETLDPDGADPEVNYVIDGQAGLGFFGRRLALEAETALSLYHDNARGDLWSVIDTYRNDPDLDRASKTTLRLLDEIPDQFRSFFQLPDPHYGVPLVDVGAQVGLRLALPWSEIKAKAFRFGRDFHTVAGLGASNVEGYRAGFDTRQLFDAMRLWLEYERGVNGVPSLLDMLHDEVDAERTQYTSFSTRLSLGRPGDSRLILYGRLMEETPVGEIRASERTSSLSLQFGDRISYTPSVDVHYGIGAELKRFDTLVTGDTRFQPGLSARLEFTAWQPRLGPVAVRDLRAQTAVSIERIKDTAEQETSWKAAVSASAQTRITPSTVMGVSGKSVHQARQSSETTVSGFLRWHF
jgi:hypothetical protein